MSAPQRTPTERKPFPVVLVVVIALVIAAAVAAVIIGGSDDDAGSGAGANGGGDDPAAALDSTVEIGGGSLAPLPESGTDPAVGEPAPTFTGVDFDGEEHTIGDDGRPKVVLFLAHWCPHCQNEVRTLQPWLDGGDAPDDVDFYSVATANDPGRPNYPPSDWLEDEGWTVPVLIDGDDSAAQAAGLTSFPYWLFIDAEGDVAGRMSGELGPEQLERILADLAGAPA